MVLTPAEFCRFNLKSRIQFIEKDGIFLVSREVVNKFIVKLYKLYQFWVEVIVLAESQRIIKIEPVLNLEIIELYRD